MIVCSFVPGHWLSKQSWITDIADIPVTVKLELLTIRSILHAVFNKFNPWAFFWTLSLHVHDQGLLHRKQTIVVVGLLVNFIFGCNGTRTHNQLVCKWKLNHLAKLAKWLSCVVSIYLCGVVDCMFLSFHICVSESICIL